MSCITLCAHIAWCILGLCLHHLFMFDVYFSGQSITQTLKGPNSFGVFWNCKETWCAISYFWLRTRMNKMYRFYDMLFCALMIFTDHSYSNWLFKTCFFYFLLAFHESYDITGESLSWWPQGSDLSEGVSHRSLSSHDVRSSVPRICYVGIRWNVGMYGNPEKAVWSVGQEYNKVLCNRTDTQKIWKNRMR